MVGLVEHSDTIAVRVHIREIRPEVDVGFIIEGNAENGALFVRNNRLSLVKQIASHGCPMLWVQAIKLHGDEIFERVFGIAAVEVKVETSSISENFFPGAFLYFYNAVVVGGNNIIMSFNGDGMPSEIEGYISLRCLPNPHNIKSRSRCRSTFGIECPTELPHPNEGCECRLQVDTERTPIIPLRYPGPTNPGERSFGVLGPRKTPSGV